MMRVDTGIMIEGSRYAGGSYVVGLLVYIKSYQYWEYCKTINHGG